MLYLPLKDGDFPSLCKGLHPMAKAPRGAKTAFEQSNAMKPIKAEMAVKKGEKRGWYGKR